MQKLIAKYGLAAHLALLAAAPLFLCPFCSEREIGIALLWLSGWSAIWMLMEPSVIGSEQPHEARRRVFRRLRRDPLFWCLLLIVVLAGVRALNVGVGLSYNPEVQLWQVREPKMPIMPASVKEAGFLPFAGAVALWVILMTVRHALGRSARTAFLLVASTLAGLGAVVAMWRFFEGDAEVVALLNHKITACGFATWAYGVYFIAGTVALLGAFENGWRRVVPLAVFFVGGTGAGLFVFSSPEVATAFLVADIPVFIYTFFFAHRRLRGSGEFKCLVVFAMSVTLAVVAAMTILPEKTLAAKMVPIKTGEFFNEKFFEVRSALSDLSLKIWKASPWTGTGIGSYGIDVRVNATESNWDVIPNGQASALNGGWQVLVERGIVGAAIVALPILFLLFSYGRAIYRARRVWHLPHPLCLAGLLALVTAGAVAVVDVSFLRPEAMMIVCAVLAVAAKSFPKEKKIHG